MPRVWNVTNNPITKTSKRVTLLKIVVDESSPLTRAEYRFDVADRESG